MSGKNILFVCFDLLALVIASAPAPAIGQDLDELQRRIQALSESLDTQGTSEQPAIPAATAAPHSISEQIDALQTQVLALNDRVESILKLRDEIQRQLDEHNNKLQAIAEQDGDRYVPNILGNMKDSPFFQERFMRSVQGKLVVSNRSQYDVQLKINGVLHSIPAQKQLPILVPYGKVTTQLVTWRRRGQEQWNEWKIPEKKEDEKTWNVSTWEFAGQDHSLPIKIEEQ